MMSLFLLMLSGYVFGTLSALVFGRGALSRGLSAVGAVLGSCAGFALGVTTLASGGLFRFSIPFFLPLTGFALQLDGLSAFFLIVIGLIGVSTSIYGFGYAEAYEGRYSLRMLGAMLNVLLLSLSLQVIADNALTFLLFGKPCRSRLTGWC